MQTHQSSQHLRLAVDNIAVHLWGEHQLQNMLLLVQYAYQNPALPQTCLLLQHVYVWINLGFASLLSLPAGP